MIGSENFVVILAYGQFTPEEMIRWNCLENIAGILMNRKQNGVTWDYDVVVYLNTLPKIKNHNIKVQVMRAFGEGAAKMRCCVGFALMTLTESSDIQNKTCSYTWMGRNEL